MMQIEELIIPSFEEFKEYFLTKYPFNDFSKELKEYPNPENINQEFMDKYFMWYRAFSHYKNGYWQGGLSSYIGEENALTVFDSDIDVVCIEPRCADVLLKNGLLIAKANRGSQHHNIIQFENGIEYTWMTNYFFCLKKDLSYEGFGFKKGDVIYYLKGDKIHDAEVLAVILDRKKIVLKSNSLIIYNYNKCDCVLSEIHSSEEKIFLNKEDAEQYKLRRDEKEKDVKPFQYTVENKDGRCYN